MKAFVYEKKSNRRIAIFCNVNIAYRVGENFLSIQLEDGAVFTYDRRIYKISLFQN